MELFDSTTGNSDIVSITKVIMAAAVGPMVLCFFLDMVENIMHKGDNERDLSAGED